MNSFEKTTNMTQKEFDEMAEQIKWETEQETEALIQFLYKKIKPT